MKATLVWQGYMKFQGFQYSNQNVDRVTQFKYLGSIKSDLTLEQEQAWQNK